MHQCHIAHVQNYGTNRLQIDSHTSKTSLVAEHAAETRFHRIILSLLKRTWHIFMIFQFRCLLTVLCLSNNQRTIYIILRAKYVCLRWPCPSNEQWFILKSRYHSVDIVRKWDEWNLEFMNPSLSAKQVPGSYTGNKCIAAFQFMLYLINQMQNKCRGREP